MLKERSAFVMMVCLCLALMATPETFAQTNDLSIRTGGGEELHVKNGWFGRKNTVAKDRLGNKYEQKTGLFGTRESEVSILGNSARKKNGLFGSSKTEYKTILGDSVKVEKGWFGRKRTSVDASGVTGLLGGFLGSGSDQ